MALDSECCNAECCYAECRYAECCYTECCHAECCYAECRYAECRGASFINETGSEFDMIVRSVHFDQNHLIKLFLQYVLLSNKLERLWLLDTITLV
jgi:hypothetical protein